MSDECNEERGVICRDCLRKSIKPFLDALKKVHPGVRMDVWRKLFECVSEEPDLIGDMIYCVQPALANFLIDHTPYLMSPDEVEEYWKEDNSEENSIDKPIDPSLKLVN